jgi:[ribosomal protein S18]-alanine N-acetyltransferase
MPAAVLIQRASPAQAGLMAALHAGCFDRPSDRPWDEAAMTQFIAGPGTVCLIGFANDAGQVPAGLLIARIAADEAELLTLGVVPACRRTGLGRALLEEATAGLRAKGAQRLFLEVEDGNTAARALYRVLGAEPVGRRTRYYENGADAAIFCLALSDSHSDDGQITDAPREDQDS